MPYGDDNRLAEALRTFLKSAAPEKLAVTAFERMAKEGEEPARVFCLGKAAPALARAAEAVWPGVPGFLYGTSPHGKAPRAWIELYGDHPNLTAGNLRRTREVRAWLERGSGPLLACVSGGGSALLVEPRPPWTLQEKAAATAHLIQRGATIGEINAFRARLSTVKAGGLLGSVRPWPVLTAIWSDVGANQGRLVSSAPTLPWRSRESAEAVAARYDLRLARPLPEPGPKVCAVRGDRWMVLFDALALRRLVAARLREEGYGIVEMLVPEGLHAGRLAEKIAERFFGQRSRAPLAVVGTGEATVIARGAAGRGGRCSHLAAALALEMEERSEKRPWLFAALATDGVDGSGGAGAFTDSTHAPPSSELRAALERCDTGRLWERRGGLLPRRPTGNNLRDLWVLADGPCTPAGANRCEEEDRP
jgi:hydroxypyruvate reductase